MSRARVYGVPLDLLTMDETVERCVELIETQRPVQHVVLNASKVVMMADVAGLREIVSGCALVNADGQSVVWGGRFLGARVPERVAGIDLMERLLAEAQLRDYPVFFLGATQEVLDAFVEVVRARYPRIRIAGVHDGYFDDDAVVARRVAQSGARILFVAISSPRKEQFLAERLGELGPLFAMGVGGSFDVWAGKATRAPRWMQRAGLEWFHRFAQEPARMWRRYLVGNARFVAITLRERFRPS